MIKKYTIENFKGWLDIVDYESDETTVTLINSQKKKIAEFNYPRFTQEDFDRFKTTQNK